MSTDLSGSKLFPRISDVSKLDALNATQCAISIECPLEIWPHEYYNV